MSSAGEAAWAVYGEFAEEGFPIAAITPYWPIRLSERLPPKGRNCTFLKGLLLKLEI